MTTAGAIICQRCKDVFAPGTQLTYVKNKDEGARGKNCCEGCVEYYRLKAGGSQAEAVRQPYGTNIG